DSYVSSARRPGERALYFPPAKPVGHRRSGPEPSSALPEHSSSCLPFASASGRQTLVPTPQHSAHSSSFNAAPSPKPIASETRRIKTPSRIQKRPIQRLYKRSTAHRETLHTRYWGKWTGTERALVDDM
ncbi:hypothetical protein FA95DRAFT_1555425, partial [Auriscalpium vulgare]